MTGVAAIAVAALTLRGENGHDAWIGASLVPIGASRGELCRRGTKMEYPPASRVTCQVVVSISSDRTGLGVGEADERGVDRTCSFGACWVGVTRVWARVSGR